jgi:hypothetical protein
LFLLEFFGRKNQKEMKRYFTEISFFVKQINTLSAFGFRLSAKTGLLRQKTARNDKPIRHCKEVKRLKQSRLF